MPDVPPEDNLTDKILQSNAENGRNPWTTSSGGQQVVGKDKPSPNLTSQEKARLEKEATIFSTIQFQVQKLLKGDEEKGETARATTPAAAAQQTVKQDKEKKKPFKFPLLAALAIGITAFAAWIADFIGPVAEFISKTLPKLFKPMSKMAGGFFKAMKGGKLMTMFKGIAGKIGGKLMKFGRFIPVIGSLFSFGFGIARWKKGEYIPAIFEFVSGILNLLPFGVTNIASMVIDGALLLYDLDKEAKAKQEADPTGESFSLWDKIRGYFLMSPGIQNIMSLGKAIGAVFRGDWKEAGKHFLHSLPGVGNILFWITEAQEGNPLAGNVVGKVSDFFKAVGDKIVSFFKSIVDGLWDSLKGAGDIIARVGKAMWAGMKALKWGGESPTEAFNRVMEEADDGAVLRKGNKLIRFNRKDDILAMKPGGVVEKFLKGSHVSTKKEITGLSDRLAGIMKGYDHQMKVVTKSNQGFFAKALGLAGSISTTVYKGLGTIAKDFLGTEGVITEIKTSNQHLGQLVQLTAQLVAGQGQPVPAQSQSVDAGYPDLDMPGGVEGPSYSDGRVDFTNSAYHIQGV